MRDPPATGHIVIYDEGSLIVVHSHYTKFKKDQVGGGKRGSCRGFSQASRKRMMILLNKLKESELRKSNLITLTYHRDYVKPTEIKKNFESFRSAFRRNYSKHSAVWKLELQRRGSPHYHLLQFGGYVCHRWVARTWNRIAEPEDSKHLHAGTRVERCEHASNVGRYLTKYLAKVEEGKSVHLYEGMRFWGVINRKSLPFSSSRVIRCHTNEAREIIEREYTKRSLGTGGAIVGSVHLFERGARGVKQWIDMSLPRSGDSDEQER